ncbi:MAG TPA: sodium:solute symporter [Chthoniobacteraceae bacterium]|jgi:SSS family transporter|nr:sodium:solute symporter [Chthoniobacteraceae bacterium]
MILDSLVILLYFIVVISIGLYKGRGDRSMQGFAIGDRNIPWWAVLASILAAEISAGTFLGTPGEGYGLRNFTYVQLAIGTILARIVVSYVFIKPYYDYRVVSIYQYLLVRFGVTTRNAASAVFLITRALASGTRMYVAAVILLLGFEMATGVKPTPSQEMWIYLGSLILLTAFTAVYTALGGIKAVVWTDLIQASVMFGAMGFAIWFLLHQIGGWDKAHELLTSPAAGPHSLDVFDSGTKSGAGFFANVKNVLETEYTMWAALLASVFTTMATHGTDQDMVQRMLTAKNPNRSRLALICSGLADIPINFAFLLIGILLWAFYQIHADPGLPEKNAHVFAYYILHELPIGVRGLLVAGLFATAMGSLSTALNALATSFTEDWYRPYIRPGATQQQELTAARWSTVLFAVILIAIGSVTAWVVVQNPNVRIIPIVLGVFGYTYGSLLGVFLTGMLTRTRGSNRGNVLAMVVGFVAVAFLSGLHNDVWDLAHPRAAAVRIARVDLAKELKRPPTGDEVATKLQTTPAEVDRLTRAPAGSAPLFHPEWLPVVEFPWRIFFGTLVTLGISLCFRTPEAQRRVVEEHLAKQALV